MGLIKMNGVNYWGSAYGQGIIAPMIYSEEEIEVGVWRDGKPLYQRVFDLGSDVLISPNNFTNTSIDASQMQTLVDAWGIYSTGVTKYSLMANKNNNIIRLQTDRNGASANVRYVVMQYTKTTDTAGSGTYTPSKALAVHYSTNEHVVGTWINNKPLYEQTIHMSANFSSTKTYSIPTAEDLFLVDGFFVCASGATQYQVPLNYPESGYSSYSGWNKTAHNVYFRLAGFSSTDVYATVRYTKTTD